MKLRTRLFVSFVLIMFMPMILFAILGVAVTVPQMARLKQSYGITDDDYNMITNSSFTMLSQVNTRLEARVAEIIVSSPESFSDEKKLDELNNYMVKRNSYLVVREDDEYMYIGTDRCSLPVINKAVIGDNINMYEYMRDNGQIFCKLPIDFENGSVGTIFIFTTEGMMPEIQNLVKSLIFTVVIILLLTAGVLVLWIYSSIVRPIGALRKAAQNIRDGNLDFNIEIRNDEMGLLAADLDDMRKRLKESAEEKVYIDQQNRQLISNITHDLKTPLTAMRGYVEGLQDGIADTPEKQKKYLHTIYNKLNDMNKRIDELSVFSKIECDDIPYDFAVIPVKDYFEDCAYDLDMELTAKGLEFGFFNYIKSDALVRIDPEQFNRVINNLISNSVKYMDKEKGIINIRLIETDDTIMIEEEDNGMGIAESDLPFIFDRFFRADRSRSSSGGSGIGLSIVKKIVEDHHGRIWVTSTLKCGTVVHIELDKYVEEEN